MTVQGFVWATLAETNMETQKGPYKDYSPFKKAGYIGFHVSLGECSLG